MENLDVSIIIVNYNTEELLKNCINSIKEKTENLKYEIIVIDNDSKDGSVEMIEKNFSDVVLIKSSENLGFGKANNLGIEKAAGKYLLLLNSDTVLLNNAIKIMFDFMENHENAGVCGGQLFKENGEANLSYGEQYSIKTELSMNRELFRKLFKLPPEKKNLTSICAVEWIIGADMFIRKNILEATGAFDPDFFMFFEETELIHRIKKQGYKIYFIPTAKIIHLESASFEADSIINFKIKREHIYNYSKYLYFQKIYGKWAAHLVFFLRQINNILLLIWAHIISSKKEKKEIKKLILNINKEAYSKWKKS